MAQKVAWTSRATEDLYTIFESLGEFSEKRAEAVVEDIINRVFLLEQFPKMGRVVPELNVESIRELIVHQYRVVYVVFEQTNVEILAIRHSSRAITDI